MVKLVFLILVLIALSCQNSNTSSTNETSTLDIQAVEQSNLTQNKLTDGWYAISPTENKFKRVDKKTSQSYFINPKPIILPGNFEKLEEFENYAGDKGLAVYFDQAGIDAWAKATEESTGSYLIFILDDEILTAQLVHGPIVNGASAFWKSDLTESQLNRIKKMKK